jgi:hypothetical protein
MSEGLSRIDLNVAAVAQATTQWSPPVKRNLARLILSVVEMNAIDYSFGNFTGADHETLRFYAGLHRYVTGLDLDPDTW